MKQTAASMPAFYGVLEVLKPKPPEEAFYDEIKNKTWTINSGGVPWSRPIAHAFNNYSVY